MIVSKKELSSLVLGLADIVRFVFVGYISDVVYSSGNDMVSPVDVYCVEFIENIVVFILMEHLIRQ